MHFLGTEGQLFPLSRSRIGNLSWAEGSEPLASDGDEIARPKWTIDFEHRIGNRSQ
jgi:hypothetical protein